MFNHAPADYDCPFCRTARRPGDPPREIISDGEEVVVRMNVAWFPNNPGAVLVTPSAHHENVYDLPPELGTPIQRAVRDTALAMKAAYGCDGVSTRQHNEPAGSQDVWHYHVHVTPRFAHDGLYGSSPSRVAENMIIEYADRLRAAWPAT